MTNTRNTIVKEYTAFAANGYRTWHNEEPMVEIITSDEGQWSNLRLTLEEAEFAIVILQQAIQEAKDYKFPVYDDTPVPIDDTPF